MRDIVYLAWRYLGHHRGRTMLLTGSIALILFLPAALRVLVGAAADDLTARAEATPLLLGAQGSAVDLALSSLYFREPNVPPIPYREAEVVAKMGIAQVIPLHLGFTVSEQRVVGTTPEYLDLRELELRDGRRFAILGEAVLGARAAERLGVGVGDAVISTPAGAFDVAGSFPLRMSVVGVLEPSHTPDDEAVFVDLKTAWAIEGIAHGHDEVVADTDPAAGPSAVTAEPTLLPYTEITPENLASFHFHGDPGDYPISAAIVVPADQRSTVLLRGRLAEGEGGAARIVVPLSVVDDLVDTLFSARDAATAVSLGLALATVVTSALVFALVIRLRRREIATMHRMGAPRGRVRAVLALEIAGVVVAATGIAAALTVATARSGDFMIRWIVS